MNIASTVTFESTPEEVWAVLMDPDVMAAVLPGCESLETVGPQSYVANLSLGVAAIKGKYESRVKIVDAQAPHSYQLLIEGKGGPGWVKASMAVSLAPQDGMTAVSYKIDAQIGGLVASVGNRMLSGVGKMLLTDMFKNIGKQLEQRRQAG
jgi:carbon monoxide dehydrogenase subunit G